MTFFLPVKVFFLNSSLNVGQIYLLRCYLICVSMVPLMLFNFYSFKEIAAYDNVSFGVGFDGSINVWGKTGGELHNSIELYL